MKLTAIDLCCAEGGASAGLVQAGFEVLGVDIEPQPRYPFKFMQADALGLDPDFLAGFDLVWASPHCQAYSRTKGLTTSERPRDVERFRSLLQRAGRPYIMENVPGAPLRVTTVLRGSDFGLPIIRERHFESNVMLLTPGSVDRSRPAVTMAGHFKGAALAREIVGMPWASIYGLAQCVPPAYAKYLAAQVRDWIEAERLVA